MGIKTEIAWTDHTFNPWWGCTKVSPGCDHCYADSFSHRLGLNIWGKDAARRFFGDKHWAEPLKWAAMAEKEGKRARVFCGSMCDVMEDRPFLQEHRTRLYQLIEQTPNLDWLLLTKRPQNFWRLLPATWIKSPRPNVWGMTTVEGNAYRWRVDALAETPFAVRGLSCEPLIDTPNLTQQLATGFINWVIVGGESGNGARPMDANWARAIRDQCKSDGVAFFMKQLGGVRDKRDELEDLPADLRIREFPGVGSRQA